MDLTKSLLRFAACVLLLVAGATTSHATPTVEDYGALPRIQMMALSPDGQKIAFRLHGEGRDILRVFSLKEKKSLANVDISDIKPQHLYFLDNAKVVLVASEEKRLWGYRGRHVISTAFTVDAYSGAISQLLTPGDVIFKGQSGLGRIVGKSSDGKHVFMPAYVGEDRHDRSPDRSLLKVDLASPRRPQVVEKGGNDSHDYFVDSNGKVLAEVVLNNYHDYFAIEAHRDGDKVEIYREDTELPSIWVAGLTEDLESLIIVGESGPTNRTTYYTMSLADGSISDAVFERQNADVESLLTDINRIAYGVRYSGLTPSYDFFDGKLDKRMAQIQAAFKGHSVWLEDITPDRKTMLIRVEGSMSSGDYYLSSDDGKLRGLGAARPTIAAENVNPVATFNYKARDGLVIPTLLTIPKEHLNAMQSLPAVMLPHGGPAAHDWIGFDWMAQALASRGYLVIQPQFRGSSGFGIQHETAGRGEWGGKMQDDLTDALDVLVKKKMVDPKRVCIMGGSYGGYAALAGGAFTPDLYRCVVSINGVSDLPEMLDQEKSDHGRHHWVLSYWEDVMARGNADDESLEAISPANFAQNFRAPVLLLHGEKDKVVDFDQSKIMYKQLKRADKEVKLIELEGEDHHLSEEETRIQSLKAAVEFIDQHIGTKL